MLYLNKRDFYYGAILSALIGKKYKTVLIDNHSKDSRIYFLTSDLEDDFIAYLKFCMSPKKNKDDSTSWQFIFSKEEIEYLANKLCKNENIKLILLCGKKNLRYSEIAIIESDEIECSLFGTGQNRSRITLSRKKGFESYSLSRGGGRANDIKIPTNRIEIVN